MSNLPLVNILIGVAGSGKSTIVERIKSSWQHKNFEVICPDEIREEMCNGNRSDQSKNGQVWAEAYSQVDYCIANNIDIIFDSTMINPSKRKQLIATAKAGGFYVVGHVIDIPLEIIKKQNANRKWIVPEHIIDNMFKSFEFPTIAEGFDYIISYGNNGKIKSK